MQLRVASLNELETHSRTQIGVRKGEYLLLYPFLNDGTDGADPVILVACSCQKERVNIHRHPPILFSFHSMSRVLAFQYSPIPNT